MSNRTKKTDITAVRSSRAGFASNVTKNLNKLLAMKAESPEEIQDLNTKEVDRLLVSMARSETGFLSTLDEAQHFLPTDEGEEAFTAEEDLATDNFQDTISAARDAGSRLLALSSVLNGLSDFHNDSTAIQTYMDSNPDGNLSAPLQDLKTLYRSLREEWKGANLPSTHSIKPELDACVKTITEFEAMVASVRDRSDLATLSSSSHSSFTSAPDRVYYNPLADLPTIKVPTFAGDILEWSTFWAAFRSSIDSRTELNNTQKLQYLRQAVKDPDLQSLLHSPLETEDMYVSVIAELKDRFNKTREIHAHLTDSILKLPTPKQTRVDLRRAVDSFKRTIDTLKQTEHYTLDAFLSSRFYLALPQRLQTLWDQHTKKDKGVPPILNLLKFIKEHAETLPSVITPLSEQPTESSKKNPSQPEKKPGHSHPRGRVSMNSLSPTPTKPTTLSDYKWECILCRPEKHPLHVCSKWASLSLSEKLNHITSKSLCSNCLAGGHSTHSCKSTYRCRDCGQPHHTSIHQQSAETSTAPIHTTSVKGDQVPDALKTTAQVLLTGPTGKTLQARALLDSGAGISLASKRVAQLLDLHLESTKMELSTLQGAPCTTSQLKASLIISPLQNREIKILCQPTILQTITCDLPIQPIEQVTDLPHILGLQLADPSYHIPSQIDILLGTDLFPQILTNQSTRVGAASEPIAQATVFGWALCGPIRLLNSSTYPSSSPHNLMSTSSLNQPARLHHNLMPTSSPEQPTLEDLIVMSDPLSDRFLMSPSAWRKICTNNSRSDSNQPHSPSSICSSNSSDLQPELMQHPSSSTLQPELLLPTSSIPATSPKTLELKLDEDNLPSKADLQAEHLPPPPTLKTLPQSNSVVSISVESKQKNISSQSDIASTPDDIRHKLISMNHAEQPLTTHNRSLAVGFTTPTDLPISKTQSLFLTSNHDILGEVILPQTTSAECQTPQQIHPPQTTEALQQDLRKKPSRQNALSILKSAHSNQHHTTSLLTEKLDTFYLTRLLLCEHQQSTDNSLLINNLMLINNVSINPATLHYWIDSSIYLSWLQNRKQQVCVVTNNSISIMQTTESTTWNPRTTALIPTQPSENGLLEEQYINTFISPPPTAENYCKRPPIILDNLIQEPSIYNPPESHSHIQPMQPATGSIGTLIFGRLCIFLLMCLHIISQLLQSPYYFITMDEHHPSNHCNRLQTSLAIYLWPTSSLKPPLLITSKDSTEESVEDSTKEPSLPLPPGGCLGRNQHSHQQPEVDTADPVLDQTTESLLPSSILPANPRMLQSIITAPKPAVLQPP